MMTASASELKLVQSSLNNNPFKSATNVLILVTGASGGIGRELALQLAQFFSTNVRRVQFFLLARRTVCLEEVAREIQNLKSSSTISVEVVTVDLSNHQKCTPIFEGIGEKIKTLELAANNKKFDLCLFVHNAASLGDLTKKSSELNDSAQWHEYLYTNLVSTILLNNCLFASLCKEEKTIFLINVTSLLSIKAFPSFTQYSVGKAAREAYFRAFAAEHPNCRVLNYSPGPVDTDMHKEVSEKTYNEGVREVFSKKRHDSNLHRKLLSPTETVKRLVQLLEENNFESGARVDYFDK